MAIRVKVTDVKGETIFTWVWPEQHSVQTTFTHESVDTQETLDLQVFSAMNERMRKDKKFSDGLRQWLLEYDQCSQRSRALLESLKA